jgi:hypothetical protein
MSATNMSATGPTRMRIGDQVEIHTEGFPPYRGIVEDLAPQFRVMWFRDQVAGERKMILLDECSIKLQNTPAPHSPHQG